MTPFERLRDMARSWGGDIVRCPPPSLADRFSMPGSIWLCPFDAHLAVDYPKRQVLFWCDPADLGLGALIHEMGHVFAARKSPDDCREWRFFGFEYLIAKRAGCLDEWMESSKDYQLAEEGGGSQFGELDRAAQRSVLVSRIRFARRNGLIKRGVPVSIRREARR